SQVILSGCPRLIRHWSSEGPRAQVQYATVAPELPESAVAVPLKIGDQVIGLMCVGSYSLRAYKERHLRLLESLADQAAMLVAGLHSAERFGVQVRRRVSELELALSSTADALMVIDDKGRLVRLNRVARRLLSVEDSCSVLGQALNEHPWDQW